MRHKIHFYTDCPFFAGCENMLAVLFNSKKLRDVYDVTFSYRDSEKYVSGFYARVAARPPVYPVQFLDLSNPDELPEWLPERSKRLFLRINRLFFTFPLFAYQIYSLSKLFKRLSPDILHVNNGGYPAALSARAAVIAAKRAGVPKVMMVVNNQAIAYSNLFRWLDYPIDKLVTKSVDLFITGSKSAKIQLESVLSLMDGQVRALFNGISMRKCSSSVFETRGRLGISDYTGQVFGVVALLIPRKGHSVLLDAVHYIVHQVKSSKEFIVLIEGEGPLLDELVSFVETNSLQKHVRFIGSEKNIFDFINALDSLVLPSVSDEDFPNVVLEAMSLGKPVIATRLAGIPEQIENEINGLVVEPKNPVQLASAMLSLMADDQKRIKMGESAKLRFESYFTADIAIEAYIQLYDELILSANHSRGDYFD